MLIKPHFDNKDHAACIKTFTKYLFDSNVRQRLCSNRRDFYFYTALEDTIFLISGNLATCAICIRNLYQTDQRPGFLNWQAGLFQVRLSQFFIKWFQFLLNKVLDISISLLMWWYFLKDIGDLSQWIQFLEQIGKKLNLQPPDLIMQLKVKSYSFLSFKERNILRCASLFSTFPFDNQHISVWNNNPINICMKEIHYQNEVQ